MEILGDVPLLCCHTWAGAASGSDPAGRVSWLTEAALVKPRGEAIEDISFRESYLFFPYLLLCPPVSGSAMKAGSMPSRMEDSKGSQQRAVSMGASWSHWPHVADI